MLALAADPAPNGLSCLTQWYAGNVTYDEVAGWGLSLPGGVFVPWQTCEGCDPLELSTSRAIALSNLYAERQPLSGGARSKYAAPSAQIDHSGIELLMMATYGRSPNDVSSSLAKVRIAGIRYPFHQQAAAALERVAKRLEVLTVSHPELLKYIKPLGGTLNWRRVRGSRQVSAHSFGIAIDMNPAFANYWKWTMRGEAPVWKNRIPLPLVEAFEGEGFFWGGRWRHFDTMHFEYRPELQSLACEEVATDGAPVIAATP